MTLEVHGFPTNPPIHVAYSGELSCGEKLRFNLKAASVSALINGCEEMHSSEIELTRSVKVHCVPSLRSKNKRVLRSVVVGRD